MARCSVKFVASFLKSQGIQVTGQSEPTEQVDGEVVLSETVSVQCCSTGGVAVVRKETQENGRPAWTFYPIHPTPVGAMSDIRAALAVAG
jgi:hypothetical protein